MKRLATILVTFAALALPATASAHTVTCASVNVQSNTLAFTDYYGQAITATYTDMDVIRYSRPVPLYVSRMVTQGKGTATRKGCRPTAALTRMVVAAT